MNITDKDDKREIKQLWCIASYYFERTRQIESGLQDRTLLKKTVGDIANFCSTQCNCNLATCKNKEIMILNAHLASGAIRLNSIDEILGKKYTSTRWYFYNGLLSKKDKLKEDEVAQSAENIIHCILRHAVAHFEPDLPPNHPYQIMDRAFKKFTIENLYKNVELVMKEIKNDISPVL